jgi:hypothetical protein
MTIAYVHRQVMGGFERKFLENFEHLRGLRPGDCGIMLAFISVKIFLTA